MAAKQEDTNVLSFHDCLLKNSDLKLLEGPYWLNDKIIGFSFQYFDFRLFQEASHRAAFISPEVTQFIKLSPVSELAVFLEPLTLEKKEYVFLAVNDNQARMVSGGTHWSLLVFNREKNNFLHFDSCRNTNTSTAKAISQKMEPFLKVSEQVMFKDEESPQQSNSYDCGLYVIAIGEYLCNQYFQGNNSNKSLKSLVTYQMVSRKRQELWELILKLARGKDGNGDS